VCSRGPWFTSSTNFSFLPVRTLFFPNWNPDSCLRRLCRLLGLPGLLLPLELLLKDRCGNVTGFCSKTVSSSSAFGASTFLNLPCLCPVETAKFIELRCFSFGRAGGLALQKGCGGESRGRVGGEEDVAKKARRAHAERSAGSSRRGSIAGRRATYGSFSY
jgi:hypothetical protein